MSEDRRRSPRQIAQPAIRAFVSLDAKGLLDRRTVRERRPHFSSGAHEQKGRPLKTLRSIVGLALALVSLCTAAWAGDLLPSWKNGQAKQAIVRFVTRVTTKGSRDFVPAAARIAAFDNDGTLWSEQPVYFQAYFVFDRIKTLAAEHPEWRREEPFASALRGDLRTALAGGEEALIKMVLATHSGMTTDQFNKLVNDWLDTARHPATGRPFTDMTYQPMLELLAYLRANGFKTYIVSGGGIEFLRVFSERLYGVPPEQVIGSSIKTKYELRDGRPLLIRLPQIDFINDKAGKPLGIWRHIGRRPIAAFGNSDGDFQMLEWTTAGKGARFGLLVHHDDADREYAYDRNSPIGRLARGLDEAAQRGWTLVSMKNDWRTVYRPVRERRRK